MENESKPCGENKNRCTCWIGRIMAAMNTEAGIRYSFPPIDARKIACPSRGACRVTLACSQWGSGECRLQAVQSVLIRARAVRPEKACDPRSLRGASLRLPSAARDCSTSSPVLLRATPSIQDIGVSSYTGIGIARSRRFSRNYFLGGRRSDGKCLEAQFELISVDEPALATAGDDGEELRCRLGETINETCEAARMSQCFGAENAVYLVETCLCER